MDVYPGGLVLTICINHFHKQSFISVLRWVLVDDINNVYTKSLKTSPNDIRQDTQHINKVILPQSFLILLLKLCGVLPEKLEVAYNRTNIFVFKWPKSGRAYITGILRYFSKIYSICTAFLISICSLQCIY